MPPRANCSMGKSGRWEARHGRAEGVEAKAQGRTQGKGVLVIAVEEVLVDAQRGDIGLAVVRARGERERHVQQKGLSLAPLETAAERQVLLGGAIDRPAHP